MLQYDKHLRPVARLLRKRMTKAERKLWKRIRAKQLHGVQVYRQKPIGPHIVDFYAPRARLVIELDGSQHFTEPGLRDDAERDAYLKSQGLMVLRLGNRRVLTDTDKVVEQIYEVIEERLNHPEGNSP